MLREETKVKAPPCVVCGDESGLEVWGHRLCHGCHGAWAQATRFEAPGVFEAAGVDFKAPSGEGDLIAIAAEYERRTSAWVREQRRSP